MAQTKANMAVKALMTLVCTMKMRKTLSTSRSLRAKANHKCLASRMAQTTKERKNIIIQLNIGETSQSKEPSCIASTYTTLAYQRFNTKLSSTCADFNQSHLILNQEKALLLCSQTVCSQVFCL